MAFDGGQANGHPGIQIADFNLGNFSILDTDQFATDPFFSDAGVYYTLWAGWRGMFYSDVITMGPNIDSYRTGPGCGMDTARHHARADGPRFFFQEKVGTSGWDIMTYNGIPTSDVASERCSESTMIGGPGDQEDAEFVDYHDENGNVHQLVVWQDNRNGNWDIYMEDMATGQVLPVCACPGDQEKPSITLDGNGKPFVVWQDNRDGNWDIYGTSVYQGQTLAEKYSPELIIFQDDYIPMLVDLGTDIKVDTIGNGTVLRDANNAQWSASVNIPLVSGYRGSNYYLDEWGSWDDGDRHKEDYYYFRGNRTTNLLFLSMRCCLKASPHPPFKYQIYNLKSDVISQRSICQESR